MDLKQEWKQIKRHVYKCIYTNLHVSIASVDKYNVPTVTPIGTLFLNDNQTGFYFEKYARSLPRNGRDNKTVCILSVNSRLRYWFTSLFRNKFENQIGIKLYGNFGIRRKATQSELMRLHKRLRVFSIFKKAYDNIWGDMKYVREIEFVKADAISF